MGIIYKLTSPSGKSYIGQTIQDFEKRMYQHEYDANDVKRGNCKALYNAISHYGFDTFEKHILIECPNEDLDFYEILCIKEYNTLSPNGYNLDSGGNKGKIYSDESRTKMREKAKERDLKSYKKYEGSKELPKYTCIINTVREKGYKIYGHPTCPNAQFTDKNKTMEKKLEELLNHIAKYESVEKDIKNQSRRKMLNDNSILPEGIKQYRTGYMVVYIDSNNVNRSKAFTSKIRPKYELLEEATKYLNCLKIEDKKIQDIPGYEKPLELEIPEYIQNFEGGFRVHYYFINGNRKTKIFSGRGIERSITLKKAIDYLEELKLREKEIIDNKEKETSNFKELIKTNINEDNNNNMKNAQRLNVDRDKVKSDSEKGDEIFIKPGKEEID